MILLDIIVILKKSIEQIDSSSFNLEPGDDALVFLRCSDCIVMIHDLMVFTIASFIRVSNTFIWIIVSATPEKCST